MFLYMKKQNLIKKKKTFAITSKNYELKKNLNKRSGTPYTEN